MLGGASRRVRLAFDGRTGAARWQQEAGLNPDEVAALRSAGGDADVEAGALRCASRCCGRRSG